MFSSAFPSLVLQLNLDKLTSRALAVSIVRTIFRHPLLVFVSQNVRPTKSDKKRNFPRFFVTRTPLNRFHKKLDLVTRPKIPRIDAPYDPMRLFTRLMPAKTASTSQNHPGLYDV